MDKQPVRKRVDIAKDLRLPQSMHNSFVSKRAEIEGNATLFGPKAQQARGTKHKKLDEALLTWLKQARTTGINFDSSLLSAKVMEIADGLDVAVFSALNGCIDHFRKRHSIASKMVRGEAASVIVETIDDWKSTLCALIEGFERRDIYNADETSLFFRAQPSKFLSLKGEACHGVKCSRPADGAPLLQHG